jgi:F0F1-type ATP synthase membrane subunit c/vacuolar-type H+-ATPase subunit K
MRKLFELGGLVAAAVLIAFGITALVMGIGGHNTVASTLKQEYITGTPDMTPTGIAPEVRDILASQQQLAAAQAKAGIPAGQRFAFTKVEAPSCSVAGQLVNGGDRARCFAQYMRIHALGATGGLVYSQMGRFVARPGTPVKFTDFQGGTNDPTYAAADPTTKQPVSNGRRDLWVTETALTTALNTSYMASRISLFGIVVGIALLLSGIGFGILAIGGALRHTESALARFARRPAKARTGTTVSAS